MAAGPTPLPELTGIDRATFQAEVRPAGRPVVLRGAVANWPICAASRHGAQAAAAYLKQQAGGAPIPVLVAPPEAEGRLSYSDDMAGLNFSRHPMPIATALDQIMATLDQPDAPTVAIQAIAAETHLAGFAAENGCALPPVGTMPRLWIGNRASIATHFDAQENIACVVTGCRRFIVFPPDQIANLYPGPFELTPAGTPVSMVSAWQPDLPRYPRFAMALAAAQWAELTAGDAIYIPYLWWHGVEALANFNVLVNYWWRETETNASPFDAMLHALLALREQPPAVRTAWRALFEHFVFSWPNNGADHLPTARRGVLGPIDAVTGDGMRARLIRSLGGK